MKSRIHSVYLLLLFVVSFVLLFPFFVIFATKQKWHKYAYAIHYWWGKIYFTISFIKVDIDIKGELDKNKQYVFCANHFSYLDIPSVVLIPHPFAFVGKSGIKKIPLFGYMFRKLHVSVDRSSFRDKLGSFKRSVEIIKEGKSLMLFPEGGIINNKPPLANFKEGAFRIAIECQVPIVPVTIPYNWVVLPDDGNYLIKSGKIKIVVHEPISTLGMTIDDVGDLKQNVFNIICTELDNTRYENK